MQIVTDCLWLFLGRAVRRLDSSEVLIVSPADNSSTSVIGDSGVFDDSANATNPLQDTSHVSVVTVGETRVRVKDSSGSQPGATHIVVDGLCDFIYYYLVFINQTVF